MYSLQDMCLLNLWVVQDSFIQVDLDNTPQTQLGHVWAMIWSGVIGIITELFSISIV